jgi:biotin transport system permease protein
MTFGLYIQRRSPIHKLSATLKILILVVTSVAVFLLAEPIVLMILLVLTGLLLPLSRLPLSSVGAQLRPVMPLLIAVLLIQGLLGDWLSGLVALLRFTILILLATIVSLTTRMSEMMAVIERALQPCKCLGINPSQVSLMLALSLRLIPLLLSQFREIQEAQQARGLDRNWLALLVPFLVKTLRMADELSDALDARGDE